MEQIPNKFFGEVPDHILAKLPSLDGSMPFDQGMGMNEGFGGMPIMPPQMMPPQMMPPQMMPPQMMPPQMMGPQMMGPQMMPPQQMMQMQGQQINGDLGLPMMPNMMGGGKKTNEKYCFMKDGNEVDSKKYNKDFFF
jgi:hypothetical protein